MKLDSKIFVAGHRGLVGSAIVKVLQTKGYDNLVLRSSAELDLRNQQATRKFFEQEKPEFVVLAAAKVGGIVANNTYRADFIYDNLQIQNNVIHFSYEFGVKKLLFLGSTCIYPKNAAQPMKEDCLLTSPLEYTNEPYAVAKIAGIKMCEAYNLQYGTNFIAAMPTNLYGENDNYDLEKSHVLPAILRKIYLAKLLSEDKKDEVVKDLQVKSFDEATKILQKFGISKDRVEIWGSGKPRREFLYSEDMAEACVFLLEKIDFAVLAKGQTDEIRNTHINIGTGKDVSIKELAELVKDVVGYNGELYFNADKPDGTMKKLTDTSKLTSLGWKYRVELEDGVRRVFNLQVGKKEI